MSERVGDWIQTFTGRKFWSLDPSPEDVCIEDIAYALALKCRFAGHCQEFYSVAQHCCIGAAYSHGTEAAKQFLLHDAAEAYLFDAPRPVKRFLPVISDIEHRIMEAICQRFNVRMPFADEVKELDNQLLVTERRDLLLLTKDEWSVKATPLEDRIKAWHWRKAEGRYLHWAKQLGLS